MDRQAFVKMVVENAKTGEWINSWYRVGDTIVGVKAYGKWVQRMEVADKPYWSGSCSHKTLKALRSELEEGLDYLLGEANNV